MITAPEAVSRPEKESEPSGDIHVRVISVQGSSGAKE